MTKQHSLKRSLIASAIILCVCFTSLIGTTFAWFTDSATSGNNVITAGTLDIVLEYWDGDSWENAEDKVLEFKKGGNYNGVVGDVLWEPGCTYELPKIRVRNEGNLAAKILLRLNGVKGDEKLMEAITLKNTITNIPESVLNGSFGAQIAPFNNATIDLMYGTPDGTIIFDWSLMGKGVVSSNSGHTDTSPEFTISGHMDSLAGNEYQGLMIQGISVTVLATQEVYEYDSNGREYDKNAPFPNVAAPAVEVSDVKSLKAAIENGKTNLALADDVVVTEGLEIDKSITIDGNGYTFVRSMGVTPFSLNAPEVYTGAVFTVKNGATLTLEDVVVDGGAVWAGEFNSVLQRGTVNEGVTSTGALVVTEANSTIVLNEGAILQNNDGANAVNLGTRTGGKLIVNGGEIINNHSAAGAIWGGGEITLNSGKINGNHGGIGGAIRVVTNIGTVLTMNGGEMNHNYSDGNGGAIWAGTSSSNNVYVLNGGEMAYNYSASTGGAIYAGYKETVKIGGTFKMHDNSCAADLGAEIRFHNSAIFIMTGGEVSSVYDNALYLNNNSTSITGGKITGNFGYSGGVGLTWGEAEVDGTINYNLSTNHNTAYLAAEFGTLKFSVNEDAANFAQFNFKPADGYVYTEGDETKLVCMNEGYVTYWDAEAGLFKIQATN